MLQLPLNRNYINALNYSPAIFTQMDLSVGEDSDSLEIKWPHGNLQLAETAVEHLCKHLEIPVKFAKTVRSLGKPHIIPYLQKQLSNAMPKNVVIIHDESQILAITEESTLHYRGKEAIDFDTRLRELVMKNNWELKFHWMDSEGVLQYEIFLPEEQEIKTDTSLKPLWRWGYKVQHSVLGNFAPVVTAELFRMVCSNLTYLPQKMFKFNLPWMPTFDERWEEVEGFFADLGKPKWLSVESFVGKLAKAPASVREVSEARRKLLKLKVDKDDKDTEDRVEKALEWKRIKKAYALGDKEVWVEKPTKSWLSRAATPISLFDVYNIVTSEASRAPTSIDMDLRQKILVYGGKLLTGKPDIADQPVIVDWKVV